MSTTGDVVHVWRVPLDEAEHEMPKRIRMLSPHERVRAQRFARSQDRASFVLTRSILRDLLAARLGGSPAAVSFEYARAGKPRLARETGLRFSVSHSENLALIAVSVGREVGVDLEFRATPTPDATNDVFSLRETQRIRTAPDANISFYDHWTLKEALLKGVGVGFSISAARVNVKPGSAMIVDHFHLLSLDVAAEFSAALAIEWVQGMEIPTVIVRDVTV